MTLKNPVALERRMDLASLFCMISRHGPAVALAVIAMVSVVAGFIIYRTVRGKRRKARAEAADGDAYGGGGAAEADVGPSPGEGFTGSTDGSDEDSSDVLKVDPDLIQSHLKVRHRRIAVEEKPLKRDEASDNTRTTSDDKEETAFMWDINSPKATEIDEQEVSRSLQSDMYTVAEMKLEDAVDCQWSDTDKTTEDVIEEECGNKSCTEEPEPINDESHEEEEKVLKAEHPEDDYVTDEDDSAMKTRHDEEALQFVVNSQVCFKQPPHVSDNGDNDRREDNSNKAETNTQQSNMEEAVNHSTDLTVPCQSEEKNHLTCSDYSSYTSNNNLSIEKEKENEGKETVEECVDHLQTETESSTFEDASLDTCQHDHDAVLSVSLSGIITDAKAEISGITDFPDLSLNDETPQSEQREDETSPALDNHDVVCPLIPVHEAEGEPEKDVDQQEVQVINDEVSEAGFPPVLDKNGCDGENILMAEEISHLHEGMEVKEECKAHQQMEIQSSTSEQEKPSQHEQCHDEHDALDMDHDVLCPPISPPETEIQHETAENGTSVDQHIVINDDAPEENITTADDMVACPHENNLIAKEIFNPLEGVDDDDNLVNKTCNEDTDSSHFTDEQQMDKNYSYDANDGIPSTTVCHVAEESESVVLSPAPLCLHEPTNIIKGDNTSLPSVSTDAKPEISGVTEFSDTTSNGEHSQPEQTEDEKSPNLDQDTDHDTLCPPVASESQPKKDDGTLVDQQEIKMINNDAFESSGPASNDVVACDGENTSMGEELSHHNVPPCNEEKFNSETSHIEAFGGDCPNTVQITLTVEDSSCPPLLSVCEDQQSDHMINTEASGADVVAYDLMAPVMTEEMSVSIISSSCQDQQHENIENGVEQFEATTGASHDLPIFHNNLLSFNQTELKDSDIDIIPSPGVGVESGISSMAVSPDIGIMVESMTLPVVECDFQVISCHKLEEQIEAPNSFYADVALSAQRQDTIEPHSSGLSQQSQPEHADWASYESLAANEDIFGHEVEDDYHKALDQFMVQFTNNIATDELKRQTEDDIVIEVVQVKEKKEEACVKRKEMKAEDEKEEDYEKTEISIMEATMDNNEWITESNYQVLPWMNISVPSFAQDHTKPEQKPPEDSTAATDATCIDTSDIPPVVEHTAAEEGTESARKVVAVQPMPQNVNVTFRVHYLNQSPHQTVAVTGNQQELGSWKGFIPLERAKDGYWSCVVSLPAESHVEWKFVVLDKGEVCRWEECGNRLLDTGFGDDLLVHKWWGFL